VKNHSTADNEIVLAIADIQKSTLTYKAAHDFLFTLHETILTKESAIKNKTSATPSNSSRL
jgi:hypothetical protein